MRLPFLSPRHARLMLPLAAALLLALLMPVTARTSPEGENGGAERGQPSLNIPEGGLALAPFLDFLLDPSGSLDISQVSAEDRAQDFRRFRVHALRQRAGTLWLRFRLAPASAASATVSGPAQTRLDLGGQVPGRASVWTRTADHPPVPAEAQNGLFSLAGLSGGGDVFIRLDGLPGLWFAPALRTVSDSLSTPDRRVHPVLLAALAALLALCLIRSVTERGDGRLWTSILIGAALLHALWGLPSTPGGTVMAAGMPGLLAAGVALMLLPHVGRTIMRTRDRYPRLDVLLLILALPGAALALLPLLPGFAWTARLFSLWPLGAAFALLPALILLAYDAPGSALFSLACLGLVTGGGLAVWGVNQGLASPLWEQAALAGIVFAALLLAAAAPHSAPAPENAGADGTMPPDTLDTPDTLNSASPALKERARQDTPLRLEEILREPLDVLLREACSLDQVLSQPEGEQALSLQDSRRARRHTDNLVAAVRKMSTLVSEIPRLARQRNTPESEHQVFDLLKLVQSVFADVSDTLQKGDLGLSWYIAPHLGRLYKGDRDRLRFALSMLLENAARATDRGAVSLRVRRAGTSPNPGHLQFTVADTGSGTPPLRRSSLALARVWELAAEHGGDLFVNSTPHGMEISFSLNCVALTDEQTSRSVSPVEVSAQAGDAEPNPRLVILASPQALNRQMLAFFLEDQGQEIWEARDAEEAASLYTHSPAALVIFDGQLPEEDIVSAVASIRAFEGERSLPAAPFLALTLDEAQAERLRQAGCDHSLSGPVTRREFRAMCLRLASPSGLPPRPDAAAYRVPPTRSHELHAPVSPDAGAGQETAFPSPLEQRPPEPPEIPEIPDHTVTPDQTAAVTLGEAAPEAGHAAPAMSADTAAASSQSPAAAPVSPVSPVMPDRPAGARATTPAPPLSTGTAQSLPSPGLHLPPQPRKRLGWLSSLFKPTPHIAPPEALDDILPDSSSEWVGEPMPITAVPASTPDVSQCAAHPPLESPSDANAASSAGPDPAMPQAATDAHRDGIPHDSQEYGTMDDATAPAAPEAPALPEQDSLPDAAREAPAETATATDSSPAAENAEDAVQEEKEVESETEPAGTEPNAQTGQRTDSHTQAKGRHKHGGKHKRRKNRMDAMPFLSLDRNDMSAPVRTSRAGELTRLELEPPAGLKPGTGDIVELTEADMVDPPLLQQLPDLLRDLNAALEHAGSALEHRNAENLMSASDRIADRAVAFGLHALPDLALCMKEAAQRGDFEAVAQLLPELRTEVERHRRDG